MSGWMKLRTTSYLFFYGTEPQRKKIYEQWHCHSCRLRTENLVSRCCRSWGNPGWQQHSTVMHSVFFKLLELRSWSQISSKFRSKISSSMLLLEVQCFFSFSNFSRVDLMADSRWAAVIMMGLLCVAYSLTASQQQRRKHVLPTSLGQFSRSQTNSGCSKAASQRQCKCGMTSNIVKAKDSSFHFTSE